ncbi:hypothetical protein [Halocatena marina]|nr:hypothetical protein [Halocatena marina]
MPVSVSASDGWLRGVWDYYWFYTRTRTGVHAAATAALTAFGLLAYFHQGFVLLAIAAYVFPPLYLYLTTDEAERARIQTENEQTVDTDSKRAVSDGDTDSDGSDGDTDSDGSDGDTDSDGSDGDTDSDGSDGDTDSDG